MKRLKKIALLIISGLILEMLGFLYLNNVFLEKKVVANFKSIETNTNSYDKKVFSVSKKVSGIKISFDKKYAV